MLLFYVDSRSKLESASNLELGADVFVCHVAFSGRCAPPYFLDFPRANFRNPTMLFERFHETADKMLVNSLAATRKNFCVEIFAAA